MTLAPRNDVLNQPVGTNLTGQASWVLGQNEGGDVARFSPYQIVVAGFGAITLTGGLTWDETTATLGTGLTPPAAGVVLSNGTSLSPATLSNLTLASGTLSVTSANVTSALGFTPLRPSNNLSDLSNAGTARTNLGLGGAAVLNVGTATSTVAAGNDSRITGALQASSNLSDVSTPGTARRNINQGIGTLSTGSSTITVDMSAQNAFKATLTNGVGPYTLSNPTGLVAGATGMIVFTQPGSGSAQTLTYSSAWKFAAPYSNASPPPLTAALGAVDVLTWVSQDGTNCLATLANNLA